MKFQPILAVFLIVCCTSLYYHQVESVPIFDFKFLSYNEAIRVSNFHQLLLKKYFIDEDLEYHFDNDSCFFRNQNLETMNEDQKFLFYCRCQDFKLFIDMMRRYADYFIPLTENTNEEWQKRAGQNKIDLHNSSHPRHCLLMDLNNYTTLNDSDSST